MLDIGYPAFYCETCCRASNDPFCHECSMGSIRPKRNTSLGSHNVIRVPLFEMPPIQFCFEHQPVDYFKRGEYPRWQSKPHPPKAPWVFRYVKQKSP